MKKKIGIIGQFPPPMHGLSKALDTLYNSYLQDEFNLIKIDITDNKKFLLNLFKILFSKLDLYYLTISQSKFGNIRDLIIIKLIQLKKRKIVIHLHGGGFRNILDNEFNAVQKRLNYKILSKVDAGIILGDSLRHIFEGIISEDKIFIVENCVDDEFVINKEQFNNKINSLEISEKFKILYLSNFIEDKGYKHVLQLAKLVREKGDNRFEFIFAGKFFSEDDKKDFFNYVYENDINSIIDYKGVVSGKEKLELLRKSHIFILLTSYKNEGQPISIIEAAANGLIVISTRHAGIPDILNEKEMIYVEKNKIDINEIYIEIVNKYLNIEVTKDEIRHNREKVLIEFAEKKYLKKILNVFNQLLEK